MVANTKNNNIGNITVLPELDFDSNFLERFDSEKILEDQIELLHHSEKIDWSESWNVDLSTPLWCFNLHYFEYLLPLAASYIKTSDIRYLDKAKEIILSWIQHCPQEAGGTAWNSYTISMRAINWIAFYGEVENELRKDESFTRQFRDSIAAQYCFLGSHLEKDLLANHYLENLKALVVLACFFSDRERLNLVLPEFEAQVDEQILSDGVHFELSPMYQKILLEGLLRACVALREFGCQSMSVESHLGPMCDFVYSMEVNANRTPLFNDSGDNIAKSSSALLMCARKHFGLLPEYRSTFPKAGYYLLEKEYSGHILKIIFDIGEPGPSYACGHAHCDMLSVEVYVDGNPWVVNSGTYAYQGGARLAFKQTAAHNAPQVEGIEQSECWASFRMARLAVPLGVEVTEDSIVGTMRDCKGNEISRTITLMSEGVLVVDEGSPADVLLQHWHFFSELDLVGLQDRETLVPYSPEFGAKLSAVYSCVRATGCISTLLDLSIGKNRPWTAKQKELNGQDEAI